LQEEDFDFFLDLIWWALVFGRTLRQEGVVSVIQKALAPKCVVNLYVGVFAGAAQPLRVEELRSSQIAQKHIKITKHVCFESDKIYL